MTKFGRHQEGEIVMKGRMLAWPILAVVVSWSSWVYTQQAAQENSMARILHVRQTEDFTVTGSGDAPAWAKAEWEPLNPRIAGGQPAQRVEEPRRGRCCPP